MNQPIQNVPQQDTDINVADGAVVNITTQGESVKNTSDCNIGRAFWLVIGAVIFGVGAYFGEQRGWNRFVETSRFLKDACCDDNGKVDPIPPPWPVQPYPPRPIRPGSPHATTPATAPVEGAAEE